MRPNIMAFAMFLLIGFALPGYSAVKVIYDTGKTHSISPFYIALQGQGVKRKSVVYKGPMTIGIDQQIPYKTPNMKPGVFKTYRKDIKHKRGYLRPMFLIGTDTLSKKWLTKNRTTLIKRGAQGILVEASTKAQVEEMNRIARGLKLNYFSAYEIARNLQLTRYPVLISKEYIEQ